jgi:hypothetical protein
MGNTLLSYTGPATHRDARDDEILRAWGPRSAKLFNADWGSTERLSWLYTNLPATTFLYRNWPQSEEFDDMFNNPVATGQRHADEWATRVHNGRDGSSAWRNLPGFKVENQVFCGINEPTLYGSRFEAGKAQVAAYYVAFLDTLRAHGLRGGALSLGVGWPNNTGTNTRVAWEPFESVREAIVRGNHYLILHEYWDIAGPQQNLGWWFGRFKQCPWDVKIIFGELGVDRGVISSNPADWGGSRGFSGHMGAEAYIAQLHWADQYLRADRRVHSAQVFTYDYADNQWHSFAIREIREQFTQHVISQRNTADPAPTAFPLYPANVTNPLPPGGGFMIDRRYRSPNHEARPAGMLINTVVLHHTGGDFGPSLNWLINPNSGVSCHYLIDRDGSIYELVDEARESWHAGYSLHKGRENVNDFSIGIELVNDGDGVEPYPQRLQDALVWLLNDIKARRGVIRSDVVTHKAIRDAWKLKYPNTPNVGIKTDPRGLNVEAVLDRVYPPPPPPVEPKFDKIVWAFEQAARILQAEGMQREHDLVLGTLTYEQAVHERDN